MRIGDLLIQVGLIDAMQLKSALAAQRQYGGRLGDLLVDMGFLDEMMLYRALAKQLGMKLVSIPELELSPDVLKSVPSALAMKHDIFPVHLKGRELYIATSDPNDIGAVDDVQSRIGMRVKTVLAPAREISWAIGVHYQGLRDGCPPPKTKAQSRKAPSGSEAHATSMPAGFESQGGMLASKANTPAPGSQGNPAANAFGSQPLSGFSNVPNSGFSGPNAPTSGPTLDAYALARLDANIRETQTVLRFMVDACVKRGLFTQEEFLAKMRNS